MSFWYSKTKIQWFIDTIRYKEVELWSAKSSWAWWQHINKTESKIQLSWNILASTTLPEPYQARFINLYKNLISEDGMLRIDTQVHKSQADNKQLTLKKLSTMIQAAFKPPKAPRKLTAPPKHAVDARIAEKKRRSKTRANRSLVRL